jgi:predicted ribosomally synthesized peptide with nif11-like leader
MENAPELPMSHQQLEAFLDWALQQPSLQAPLSVAPDAAAVAAIASAAGFDVCSDDLLTAGGEAPEVIRMVELVAVGVPPAQSELEAFLQQVEFDQDLQRVLATAPDAECVAAVARIAGYGVSADDVWAASDESPEILREPDLVLEFWPDLGVEGNGEAAAAAVVAEAESSAAVATAEAASAAPEVAAPEVAAPEVAAAEVAAAESAAGPEAGAAEVASSESAAGPEAAVMPAAAAPPASGRLQDPWGSPPQAG